MRPDRELAAQIQRGDEAAFSGLFRALYAPLCSYANGLLAAPDIAEEIVQDVFAKLWQNRATLHIETSLAAYLYRAVRNAALNQLARRRTEQRWQADAAAAAHTATGAQPTPLDALDSAEVATALQQAIDSLPPRCREVIELRWRRGLKHAEIATALGISIKGVENQLTRGLRALRDYFAGHHSR